MGNGGSNSGLPFVHVIAKIPVPSGLSADATMSEWPDGASQIGTKVQEKLRSITGIDQATKQGNNGPHAILVFPGTLHLGAVRQTFATHLRVGIGIQYLRYQAATGKVHVEKSAIEQKLKDSLVKMAGVDEEDVQRVGDPDTSDTDEIKYVFSISARGAEAAAKKTADWEEQLLPAGRLVQKFYETTYPDAVQADHKDDYMVSVGIGDVSNEVDTIDLDLVVHGVNYDEVTDKRKKSFLTKLAEAVRQGVKDGSNGNDYVNNNVARIRVIVSPHDTNDAVNVRVQIPAPETPEDQRDVMSDLDSQLLTKGEGEGLQKKVEEQVKAIQGIEFLTTWTTKAIYVSVPGKIDDFAGDLAVESDRT